MGHRGSQPHCSPCSVATWQPVPAGDRDRGMLALDAVGGLWWDAFAFPREDGFLHTKAMAAE